MKLPPKIVARPILVALGFLFVASSAFAQAPERVRILIGFRNPPGPADEGDVRGRGGEISHRYHIVPAMAVSIPVTALEGTDTTPM